MKKSQPVEIAQEVYDNLAKINPELNNALFYVVCVQRIQAAALEQGKFLDSNGLLIAAAAEMNMRPEELRAKQMTWVQKGLLGQARSYMLSALEDDLFASAMHIASQLPAIEAELLTMAMKEKGSRAKSDLYKLLKGIFESRASILSSQDYQIAEDDGLDFVRKHQKALTTQIVGRIIDINADDKPPE